jgi:hypothetical protein
MHIMENLSFVFKDLAAPEEQQVREVVTTTMLAHEEVLPKEKNFVAHVSISANGVVGHTDPFYRGSSPDIQIIVHHKSDEVSINIVFSPWFTKGSGVPREELESMRAGLEYELKERFK